MKLNVNGKIYHIKSKLKGQSLLSILRNELGLTGAKYGCGIELCGACTVHLDGVATRSCRYPIEDVNGKEVTTIEGLAKVSSRSKNGLHPVQKAFIEIQVPQCGFCMPGQIMTAASFLNNNSSPSKSDIKNALSGNICRCGSYNRIIKAVKFSAGKIK